jgi:hypothetical protein
MNLVAILTILMLAAAPASAQSQRERYRMVWLVADPLDAATGAGQTIRIKSGDLFMRHRLLPVRAARLTSDMVDGNGKLILAKQTEMFALDAGGVAVFCEAGAQDPSGMKAVLVGGGYAHNCGIDRDGDGRFENHFKARGVVKGLPSLSGKFPKQPSAIAPTSYEAMAPAAMTARYFVGVEYEGKPLLYNRRNFRITFGNDRKQESLTDWSYISAESYPKSLTQLGGQFTVLSEADGMLTVRIDRNMPLQPFGIVQTDKYTFY